MGKEVTITSHKKGKYGRWLATVCIDDEIDLTRILLAEGLAEEYE